MSDELPIKKNKIAIAVLTRVPDKVWMSFLNNFNFYDVFLIIDDNSIKYDNLYKESYYNINFIQLDDQLCEKTGYKYSSTFLINKNVIAWDKVFYYFGEMNKNYDDVWVMEDDVFFKSENDLINIDNKFECNQVLIQNPQKHRWYWPSFTTNMNPPYFSTMVCACRMSRSLFEKISNHVKINGRLFFIECLIPTFSINYNLSHGIVKELKTIKFKKKWKERDFMKPNKLYNPLKNFEMHKELREKHHIATIEMLI